MIRFFAAAILTLSALHSPAQQAPLAKTREDLVGPWLVEVKDSRRLRLLRVLEVVEDSEGAYHVTANFGWIEDPGAPARIEVIQAAGQRRLVMRTGGGAILSLRQEPDGAFTGTFKPNDGAERPARLTRLSEEQLPAKVKESLAAVASQNFADEARDWGVAPTRNQRSGRLHAPTPLELPGAKTLRTMELRAMVDRKPPPVLVDALDGQGHRTLPGAYWLPWAGQTGRAEEERLREALEKITAGRKDAPLVFFCLSSECWLSYNAGLRAVEFGYTGVYWYRGGTAAWRKAGFEMREAEAYKK